MILCLFSRTTRPVLIFGSGYAGRLVVLAQDRSFWGRILGVETRSSASYIAENTIYYYIILFVARLFFAHISCASIIIHDFHNFPIFRVDNMSYDRFLFVFYTYLYINEKKYGFINIILKKSENFIRFRAYRV